MCSPAKTKEYRRWCWRPFISGSVTPESRGARTFEPKMCANCGSVTIIGGDLLVQSRQNERFFCDIECAGEYKRHHNKTDAYKAKWAESEYAKQRQEKKARTDERNVAAAKDKWRCCLWCGAANTSRNKWCSSRCRKEQDLLIRRLEYVPTAVKDVTCRYCGKTTLFERNAMKREYCSESCARKFAKQNRTHRKRSNGPVEAIGLLTLAKKSKWKCAMCGCKCVKPTGLNLDTEATQDHIVPLARGGTHTWSNIQLLCRRCNCIKSDRVDAGTQLLLPLTGGR